MRELAAIFCNFCGHAIEDYVKGVTEKSDVVLLTSKVWAQDAALIMTAFTFTLYKIHLLTLT
jgi:hypothetical protein